MTTWYVRPNTSHNTVRDGTSYFSAWGGWSEIVWGAGGFSAGDTLYVCGLHNRTTVTTIGTHGGTLGSRAIIRGDFPGDPGVIQFTVGGTYLVPRSHSEWQNITIGGISRCVLTSSSLSNHVAQGVKFNGGINPIFSLLSTTGNNYTDISFQSCIFTGGGAANALGSSAAFDWFCATASAVSTVSRVTFNACTFLNVNPTGDARGVVGFRSQDNVSTSSIVSDLVFSYNKFIDCNGYALEAYDGHTIGSASPQYGLWKGARVFGNTITNQGIDFTGVIGGGFSLFGFDQSTTSGFGSNIVSNNTINGAIGQAGGINVGYGTALIEANKLQNLSTYSIDACGVLIDIGAKDCIVRRNVISNLLGKSSVDNSGCAIMILDADNTQVYGNISKNTKCSVFFGTMTVGRVNFVENNTFIDCIDYGMLVSTNTYRAGLLVKNNIFSAKIGTTPIFVKDTSGGWTGENYNAFAGSFTTSGSHILGAQDKIATSISSLLLSPNFYLLASSPLIAAGGSLDIYPIFDTLYQRFWTTPSIGAHEYMRTRSFRS